MLANHTAKNVEELVLNLFWLLNAIFLNGIAKLVKNFLAKVKSLFIERAKKSRSLNDKFNLGKNIEQKIRRLTDLLKLEPDLGIVCTDSCECFDSNREYLRQRAAEETNPKVRILLEKDRDMLTRMQAEMANAREFYLVKRYAGLKPEMVFSQSNTTMKNISDNGFETERLGKDQIKRLLGIYFGVTMDGDKLPDVDGQQYEQEVADGTV